MERPQSCSSRKQCHREHLKNIDLGDGFNGNVYLEGHGDIVKKIYSIANTSKGNIAELRGSLTIGSKRCCICINMSGKIEFSADFTTDDIMPIYDLIENW